MPNILETGPSIAEILRFFKMAVAAILDCQIYEILLADVVRKAQTHHCSKFRQNRLQRH